LTQTVRQRAVQYGSGSEPGTHEPLIGTEGSTNKNVIVSIRTIDGAFTQNSPETRPFRAVVSIRTIDGVFTQNSFETHPHRAVVSIRTIDGASTHKPASKRTRFERS